MTPFLLIPIHRYTNTNTQIHQYTNTQIQMRRRRLPSAEIRTCGLRQKLLLPTAQGRSLHSTAQHIAQHTKQSTEHTAHSTLHTQYSTQYSTHCTHTTQQLLRREHDWEMPSRYMHQIDIKMQTKIHLDSLHKKRFLTPSLAPTLIQEDF